jgi:hypothetical protein
MTTSFEQVNTQWFDEDALRLPNYTVGRINYGNGRSYVKLVGGELAMPFKLYTSLTTAINTCAPMEKPLLEWYCKLGLAEADRQLKISQHYGTLMHLLIGEFLINNFFDFDQVDEKVNEYLSEQSFFEREAEGWADKLKYDIAAFIAFAQDYKVKPLGIEYVLLSNKGYGTLIDLVCKMTIEEKGFFGEVYKSGERKGEAKETKQAKEITALINFKSGRHQFYRSNGIQAECERLLWEENFPDIKIDASFNWSPKEWITEPGYNLKDWKGEIELTEIEAVLQIANVRFGSKAANKKFTQIKGTAVPHKHISNCISTIGAYEYCANKYSSTLVASYQPNDQLTLVTEG